MPCMILPFVALNTGCFLFRGIAMDTCEICGGRLGLLGVLGNLDWLRCQDCGMEYNAPRDEEALETREEVI